MSFWFGIDGEYAVDTMPHITKIVRKPRGVGAEAKAVCDGDSGVMLRLDFMEGQERQHEKQWYAQYGEGTAVALRLCSPWAGSGRYVVMDSAFGSVKTCIAMLSILGLFCVGMVKTASRCYPKKWFSDWYKEGSERDQNGRRVHAPGTWKTFQSTFQSIGGQIHKLIAVGWHDIKLKTIIATTGTTLRGSDAIKKRSRKVFVNGQEVTQRYDRLVPRPALIQLLFDIFGRIDQHDHFRQGSLRMEEAWKTQTWWHRIVATVLGIIFTDCYLAYKNNELKYNRDVLSYDEFLGKLSYQLIFNPYYNEPRGPGVDIDEVDMNIDFIIYYIYRRKRMYKFILLSPFINYLNIVIVIIELCPSPAQ